MARLEEVETNELVPGNYGIFVVNGGHEFVFFPSQYFIASTFLMDRRQFHERLRRWQAQKKRDLAVPKARHRDPRYPLFDLGDKRDLLELDFEELRDLLVGKIADLDGTQTLYAESGHGVIHRGYFGSHVLTGDVRSRHDARRTSAQKHRSATIHNPVRDLEGRMGISDMSCSCENHIWDGTRAKSLRGSCYHIAALHLALEETVRGRKDLVKLARSQNPDVVLPFNVAPHQIQNTRYLDMDVLFDYFVLGERHQDINRKIMPLGFLFFSPVLAQMIMDGRATYRPVRRGKVKAKVPPYYIDQEIRLVKRIRKRLREEGYRYVGWCLEHSGSTHEAMGVRYSKGGRSISLVSPTTKLPPYLVMKEPYGVVEMNTMPEGPSEHPFSKLNRWQEGFDDMTRRRCREMVFLPGSAVDQRRRMYVPDVVQERYTKAKRRFAA